MKKIASFILFCLLASILPAQDQKAKTLAKIDSLTRYKEEIARRNAFLIDSLNQEVVALKLRVVDADIADHYFAINDRLAKTPVVCKSEFEFTLLDAPNNKGKTIIYVKRGSSVTVLGIEQGRYYKVKFKGKTGFTHSVNLDLKNTSIEQLDRELYQLTSGSSTSSPSSTGHTPAPTSYYAPSSSSQSTGTGTPHVTDPTIHTGPRGGKYYYTASGKKQYVSKKKKN